MEAAQGSGGANRDSNVGEKQTSKKAQRGAGRGRSTQTRKQCGRGKPMRASTSWRGQGEPQGCGERAVERGR